MKIVEIMPWNAGDNTETLDWMGRTSPAHMPPNSELRQIASRRDLLAGDNDPDAEFQLVVWNHGKKYTARPGDWIAKIEDGSFVVRKDSELTFLRMDPGGVVFHDSPTTER